MVDKIVGAQETAARDIILKEIRRTKRGLTITNLVKNSNLNRSRVRTAIAYLLGSGKIEEVRVGMAKLYYLI